MSVSSPIAVLAWAASNQGIGRSLAAKERLLAGAALAPYVGRGLARTMKRPCDGGDCDRGGRADRLWTLVAGCCWRAWLKDRSGAACRQS